MSAHVGPRLFAASRHSCRLLLINTEPERGKSAALPPRVAAPHGTLR